MQYHVSYHVVCHSAWQSMPQLMPSWHQHRKPSIVKFFFHHPRQVPLQLLHRPIAGQKRLHTCFQTSRNERETTVSVLLGVTLQWRKCLWSYDKTTLAFMMFLRVLPRQRENGLLKIILPKFSLTVIFMQSSFFLFGLSWQKDRAEHAVC